MTEAQRKAQKRRFRLEDKQPLQPVLLLLGDRPHTIASRAHQGGVARYRKSLQPGQLSMSAMSKMGGGRPKALTLKDVL